MDALSLNIFKSCGLGSEKPDLDENVPAYGRGLD